MMMTPTADILTHVEKVADYFKNLARSGERVTVDRRRVLRRAIRARLHAAKVQAAMPSPRASPAAPR
jgi:hypothetical protein